MLYHNIERELLDEGTLLSNQFESTSSLQDSWEIKHKHLANRKHLSSSAWRRHLSLGRKFSNSNLY